MARISDNNLTRYLEGYNLAPEQVNEIMARYADAVANGDAATWGEDQTFQWVDDQVSTLSDDPAETTPKAGGAASTRMAIDAAATAAGESAQRAADDADNRAAQVRSRYKVANEYVVDAGPSMNPDQISTSLAIGNWVDEKGNYIDPDTGQRVDTPIPADAGSVWNQIRGQTFNMGSLTMPGYKERRTTGFIPVRRGFTGTEPGTPSSGEAGAKLLAKLGVNPPPGTGYNLDRPSQTRFLSPSQAMALLGSMDEEYLTKLQHGMWDAGLYAAAGDGARPDWGKADPYTRQAFQSLFIEASLDPKAPISQVLANLAQKNILNLGDVPGAPGSTSGQAPDFKPEVASAETLGQMIDEIGQNLLGEYVDPKTKQSLIERLQAKETDTQRQQYMQDVSTYNAGGASGVKGMEDIDAFMAAISGRESGGDYNAVNASSGASGKFQIMPANWRPWATRAGLGPDAPKTPANQEIVAKRIMMDYYAQFGNWRDVAIAWFAGSGAVGDPSALARSDGNMTVAAYADDVLNRLAAIKGGKGDLAGGAVGQQFSPIERFDPAAESQAAIKAANPAAYVGHQWGDRAVEYFNLLGGVN